MRAFHMAKKKTSAAPRPTFEVRFVGRDISPEKITLRQVNDALSAIQDIASGRDPFEEQSVPAERGIGLVDVSRGSAVFSCVSRAPDEAIRNLTQLGVLLNSFDVNSSNGQGDALALALPPIHNLSEVARSVGCELQVRKGRRTLFTVTSEDYKRISAHMIIKGDTTIVGRVQRVGGATDMKCALRVADRRKLLYCDVNSRELVRDLGQHLYDELVVSGSATWINRTWRLIRFTIKSFEQIKMGEPSQAIQQLREAGLSAWDDISDPEQMIRKLRT
jgi:hypothetical protein